MSVANFAQYLELWQSVALRCCVASFVVMIAVWIAILSLRNYSAALRHRILVLGLAGLELLPALVLASQGMSPSLRIAGQQTVVSTEPFVVEHRQSDTTQSSNPLQPLAMPFAEMHDFLPKTMAEDVPPEPVKLQNALPVPTSSPVVTDDPERQGTASALPPIPLWSLTLLIWGTIATVLAIRALLDRILLLRTLRSSIGVTDKRALQMLRTIADTHGIREASLLCSQSVHVPIAIGSVRPHIVLPAGYGKWSDERLHIVLLHEMMHIVRADVLAQSIAGIACTLFWFNPLAWKAASRMRLERELATDDSVLLAGEDAVDYANHLVEIAAAIGQRFRVPAAASAMATHTNLRSRVDRLMQQEIDRSQVSRHASTRLLLLAVMIVTGLSVVTPTIGMSPDDAVAKAASVGSTEATISGELDGDWLEQLKAMSKLEKLVIRRPGRNFRASAIRELTGVKTLQVEDFPLGSPLADVVLQNATKIPSLRNVTFKGTGLSSNGLNAFADSPIVALSLVNEELVTDDGFAAIGKMLSLESLELNGTPIEAPGLSHLKNCPRLRRLVLLRDRGATKRIPEIAGFKWLEKLELSDISSNDLVDLKKTQSLRELTLRRCGVTNSRNTLEQLTQLKRVSLDDTDISDESFDDVRGRLAQRGIALVDVTQMVAVTSESEPAPPVSEATELARRVHRELNYAKQHPTLWMKWKSDWGDVASMKGERIRTINLLRKALGSDYSPRPGGFDDSEIVMAWTPGQMFIRSRHFKNREIVSEAYKYGDAELAWAREGKVDSPKHFPRKGVVAFADSIFDMPEQLKVSHQDFWWGTSLHHNLTTSSVSPETATYRELPGETFGGEECRVVESPGRSERLWISIDTGRLRGMLTYVHQGYFAPFYRQPIVTQIFGREVRSQDEYRTRHEMLTKEQRSKLSQAWAEYKFDSGIPGVLYVFSDYREIAPQSWFPFEVRRSGWLHNEKNQNYYNFHASTARVTELATDRTDLKSLWEPLLPKEGEKVQDQRFSVAVDYEYKQDRTTAEIEALVSEKLFEYAESQILIDERRNPLNKLLNKPAMELPIGGWLGDQPDLKGKPYLLHFWATWCGPCKNDVPVLNAIAKNSIVIGVHPSGTPQDDVRQGMADAEMTYPTIVAGGEKEIPLGYPVTMFPYCVKVDANGTIVKHGFLNDVLGRTPPDTDRKEVAAHPKVSGTVIATDPAKGLIQFSLGVESGIEPQQVYDIVRKGKRLSQLRVVLVKENRSVGKVVDKEKFDSIIVGDKIQP